MLGKGPRAVMRDRYRQIDRQPDILLTEIKVITDLFVIVIREICTCIYKNVSLLKSNMTIYMVTTKIMLNGIAIIKTGYYSHTNDYFLK